MPDTAVHHSLQRVRLEPARGRGDDAEASAIAYEFVAPLGTDGHLSVDGWKAQRALCFVHRLENGDIVARGLLQHHAGGARGGTWTFDYEPGGDVAQEVGWHFEAHAFVAGEYVSIRGEDAELRTFRIASVTAAAR